MLELASKLIIGAGFLVIVIMTEICIMVVKIQMFLKSPLEYKVFSAFLTIKRFMLLVTIFGMLF